MKDTAANPVMNTETYEIALEKDGVLFVRNKGDSMFPLIREGRDVIEIEPVARDKNGIPVGLKKNDVILFKMGEEYILHRIVQISRRNAGYRSINDTTAENKQDTEYAEEPGFYCITCGDHRICSDPEVNGQQILGIMTGLVRKGKTVDLQGAVYRSYVRLWCDCFLLKKTVLRVLWKFKKLRLKCLDFYPE